MWDWIKSLVAKKHRVGGWEGAYGSLREAVANAKDGEIIFVDCSMTDTLDPVIEVK